MKWSEREEQESEGKVIRKKEMGGLLWFVGRGYWAWWSVFCYLECLGVGGLVGSVWLSWQV